MNAYHLLLTFHDGDLTEGVESFPDSFGRQPDCPVFRMFLDRCTEEAVACEVKDVTPLFVPEARLVVVARPDERLQFPLPSCSRREAGRRIVWV